MCAFWGIYTARVEGCPTAFDVWVYITVGLFGYRCSKKNISIIPKWDDFQGAFLSLMFDNLSPQSRDCENLRVASSRLAQTSLDQPALPQNSAGSVHPEDCG